jgi:hypothetical protein
VWADGANGVHTRGFGEPATAAGGETGQDGRIGQSLGDVNGLRGPKRSEHLNGTERSRREYLLKGEFL